MSTAPTEIVRVERPATGGAVAHLDSGQVVFVRHAIAGELVEIAVRAATAKVARAEVVTVLEASPDRVSPPCRYAHAGGCGGCDFQHVSVAAQKSWKATLVTDQLRRLAGVHRDVEVATVDADPRGTRTRLRCGVDEEGRLGLRQWRSEEVVALERCWISEPAFAPAFSTSFYGAHEVELRAIGDGEPFAVITRESDRGTLLELTSLRGEPLEPSTHSRVAVDGHVFKVSPRSFWQSHRSAPEILLDAVLRASDVTSGDHVVDLFSGVGLFSIPLAKRVGPGGRVTAVESSPYAVRDARENGDRLRQLKVREWSVTPRAVNDSVMAGDVVVLDPPRTGLAKGVAAALVRRSPRRLVYVSCDPATFARDLASFSAGGYHLADLRVFDLFPMTEHVELVAVLDTGAERVESASGGRNVSAL